MKKLILLGLAPLLLSLPAQALVELRAGYGITTPADDNYNGSTVKTMTGLNLDGIIELPMVPVGLGLRYESMGFDVEVPTVGTAEADMKRLSLLVNYRLIDLFTYVGFIGTIGFSNEIDSTILGTTVEYDSDMTFSIGAEAGVSLGLIMIGGELGYFMGNFESSNGANSDLDMSGIYAKAIVGVGF